MISVAGYSTQPAMTIATDTMTAMLGAAFPWKWNRFNATPFYTISFQQDYASLSLNNVAWIEHAFLVDINNTASPQPVFTLEAVRDLERTYQQYGRPGWICWLPNDQLVYATWGGSSPMNPGPNVVYTNPLGAVSTPSNPMNQVRDPNGNLLVMTTYGTCGSTQPTWPSANAAVGTPVVDGTCIWTVVNPKGQGFRLSPLPPQAGVVYQVNPVCQMRPPLFTSLAQTLEPIPDDFASYFRQGFVAHCYQHSPDPKVRAKFSVEYGLWISAMTEADRKGDRERDAAGFYPSDSLMDNTYGFSIGPANPYGG